MNGQKAYICKRKSLRGHSQPSLSLVLGLSLDDFGVKWIITSEGWMLNHE